MWNNIFWKQHLLFILCFCQNTTYKYKILIDKFRKWLVNFSIFMKSLVNSICSEKWRKKRTLNWYIRSFTMVKLKKSIVYLWLGWYWYNQMSHVQTYKMNLCVNSFTFRPFAFAKRYFMYFLNYWIHPYKSFLERYSDESFPPKHW